MLALLSEILLSLGLLPQPTSLDGNTVIYTPDPDGSDGPLKDYLTYYNSTTLPGLPDLPKGTRMVTMGPATHDGYDGFITVGGHWSLTHGSSYYAYGKQMRRAVQIFADWVNLEHGGVKVGGKKYAMRFVWVDDRSSKYQVMNATATALRGSSADFCWAGYASGLTTFTTKQAHADGYLMVSGGAASTSVFSQNNMSFGLFPPASIYTKTALQGIAEAADRIDAGSSNWPWASRCGGGTGCKSSIRVGIIQAGAGFTRSQCATAADNARANGLTVLTNGQGADGYRPAKPSADLVLEIPKAPTLEQAVGALTILKDAGVNVITACTYSSTANKLIDGLYNMSWAPLSLSVSATVGTQGFADRVWAAEGYKAEFVLGYEIWHGSVPRVGAFSGMTSAEFVSRFSDRFDGAKPSYHGAAQFGVGVALVLAIELADSLDPSLVAAQLRTLSLPDFYADISFDANGQLAASMLVLQFMANSSKTKAEGTITYPDSSRVLDMQFPMPDWPIRKCWDVCNPVTGHCSEEGLCICTDGYHGATCEEADVITVADKMGLVIMASVLGPILGLLLIFGLYRFALFIKKAWELKAKEEESKVKRCRASIEAAVTLQSPAYLITFQSFQNLGKLVTHEEARKKGLFVCIDEYEELVNFSTENPVVFFSHQWLAWAEPDPDGIQFKEMLAASLELCKRHRYSPEDLYIFVDVISIPQRNMRQRMCAIETLGCFASIFEHFIIIAPDSVHLDTKKSCSKASYQRRGWCRLEQWGRMCGAGTDGMYWYNGPKSCLQRVDTLEGDGCDWALESIMVFEGDFTDPESKAELVDTVLGLYSMVLVAKDSTAHILHNLITQHSKRVFPDVFFGDLPMILHDIVCNPGHRFNAKTEEQDTKNMVKLKRSSTALCERSMSSVDDV